MMAKILFWIYPPLQLLNDTTLLLSDIKLSIIVTVYSETFSISKTIEILLKHNRGYIKEIILLISPRSSAETFRIANQEAAKNPLVKIQIQKNNPGVGWAYREGMEVAAGNHIALMAADLETEPATIDRMVRKIEETGCDGVIANRWLKGGGFIGYNSTKLVLNWIFQKVFMVLYWTKISDLTFGFKILSRQIAKQTQWTGTLHEICGETTFRPIQDGYYIEQVPSPWVGRQEGQSINKFLRNFRYVWLALKIRFNLI